MTLKRLMAPEWPIERKTKKFVVKPRPGPHSSAECLPLGVVIRDILGHAATMNEVVSILNAGHVKVDGAVRKDRGFPLGLMDVLSMGEENYRILVGKKGLLLEKIKSGEASIKLLRVENKTHVNGGVQLNLHDGRNILVDKDNYKTGDVIIFDLEKKQIKEALKMEKGSIALITGGNNTGSLGTIAEIIITKSSMPNQVVLNLGDRKITLPKNYIFVVGHAEPVIALGEGR